MMLKSTLHCCTVALLQVCVIACNHLQSPATLKEKEFADVLSFAKTKRFAKAKPTSLSLSRFCLEKAGFLMRCCFFKAKQKKAKISLLVQNFAEAHVQIFDLYGRLSFSQKKRRKRRFSEIEKIQNRLIRINFITGLNLKTTFLKTSFLSTYRLNFALAQLCFSKTVSVILVLLKQNLECTFVMYQKFYTFVMQRRGSFEALRYFSLHLPMHKQLLSHRSLSRREQSKVFKALAINAKQRNEVSKTTAFGNTSESRTIVVTSGKGGVGKTTTTANLGMSIARLGYRVALIDADIGLRNLDLLLGLENRVLYTAMDIFEGECRLDQALIRDKRLKNLSLLAISKNRQRYNVTRQKMESLVSSIAALGYQFILIDCPAGIDVGFINAISPAQEALIVTTPEITAMRDADRVAGLLEANGIYNAKLLINRVRPDMIQRHDMMSVQDVQDVLGIPLLGAIPEDLNVIVSTNRGEPLVLRKKLTLSGIAFENAARRLIGKQDYVIDLKTPYKSFFQKIQSIFTE